jgi:hypothetical protein
MWSRGPGVRDRGDPGEGRVSAGVEGYPDIFSARETNAPTKISAGRTEVQCKCWRPGGSDIFL